MFRASDTAAEVDSSISEAAVVIAPWPPLQLAVPSILLLTVLLNFEARVDHGFRCPEAVAVLGLSDCGLAAVATRGEIS